MAPEGWDTDEARMGGWLGGCRGREGTGDKDEPKSNKLTSWQASSQKEEGVEAGEECFRTKAKRYVMRFYPMFLTLKSGHYVYMLFQV